MFHITSLDTLAREAYDAFVSTVIEDIEPTPETFDDLPEVIKDAWKEAARRVATLIH